ncbi:PD-(D/E)XK nuclease family protein [Haladaptatus sp. DFWS20]|uniref:PD-(D/E)XK nuclease family protein n=1 Tax=Haladaptatus sp. DFWS20 TaxID=3403467 RepID=UPI003EBE50DF
MEPANDDERYIKRFIDSLDGDLRVEQDAYLPLTVDSERITIYGIIDLVHLRPETVDIIDFKTDRSRIAESEYWKQLSIYYHVLTECFPERPVTASIFYTTDGKHVNIEPLSKSELGGLAKLIEESTTESASVLD